MTKQDAINQVSKRTGLDMPTSRAITEAFFEVVKESLTAGEPIYIRTFGSFILKERAQKVGRNISQNTALTIAAHTIPAFKPSLEFTNQVKGQGMVDETKKATV